ncbi:TetR/AcrR family transcriptional regulator [Cochlodiniinecator piscidefendens]|uniref:TetR/AcrR family transcriptional regulator n=1 Tax=Cochlodiniinecator piscidefendens TaxID=2715756 RepID=UPI00140DD12F|nr:TetR/AcrR family transcriptional regulator [Cochlodiniinecator piscidefendens]
MNDRDRKIVEAAFKLFAHYGVKKTTISEIAVEAKVSRQTLYNAFASKEELMCGAMHHYAQKAAGAIAADCEGVEDILERLDIAYRHVAMNPFVGLAQIPHADEIMQMVDQMDGADKDGLMKLYADGVKHAISPAEANIREAGVTPDELSVFIKASFSQIKSNAHDLEHLHRLYSTLKQVLKPILGAA